MDILMGLATNFIFKAICCGAESPIDQVRRKMADSDIEALQRASEMLVQDIQIIEELIKNDARAEYQTAFTHLHNGVDSLINNSKKNTLDSLEIEDVVMRLRKPTNKMSTFYFESAINSATKSYHHMNLTFAERTQSLKIMLFCILFLHEKNEWPHLWQTNVTKYFNKLETQKIITGRPSEDLKLVTNFANALLSVAKMQNIPTMRTLIQEIKWTKNLNLETQACINNFMRTLRSYQKRGELVKIQKFCLSGQLNKIKAIAFILAQAKTNTVEVIDVLIQYGILNDEYVEEHERIQVSQCSNDAWNNTSTFQGFLASCRDASGPLNLSLEVNKPNQTSAEIFFTYKDIMPLLLFQLDKGVEVNFNLDKYIDSFQNEKLGRRYRFLKNADVNSKSANRSEKVLNSLLKKTSAYTLQDYFLNFENGNTGLGLCATYGKTQTYDKILPKMSKILDIDQVNSFGETALHIAARNGNWNIFQKLLQLGDNESLHIFDKKYKTPLMLLQNEKQKGNEDIVFLSLLEDCAKNMNIFIK